MLLNRKVSFIIFCFTALLFASCDREAEQLATEDFISNNKAYVKVFNATLSSVRNNLYIDNIPMTGAAGVYSYGSIFPGSVYGVAVNPGSRSVTIKDTAATTTQLPISFMHNFEAGKTYTIFTYNPTTSANYKIVETAISVPTDTTARLRFANFVYSSTPIPNVDVYSTARASNVFTNVAPTQVTDYISYASSRDTLQVRPTGTTTNLISLTFVPTEKRSYTLVFRGNYQTTGTTGLARLLSILTDY